MCATVYASTSSTPCAWGTMIRKAQENITASADFRGFHPGVSWLKSSVCRQKPSGFWSICNRLRTRNHGPAIVQ